MKTFTIKSVHFISLQSKQKLKTFQIILAFQIMRLSLIPVRWFQLTLVCIILLCQSALNFRGTVLISSSPLQSMLRLKNYWQWIAPSLHFLLRRKMYKMLLSMHNLRTQKKNMKKFWNFQHMLSLQQIANSTTS